MKKSIISLSLAFLGLGAFTTSCEDMLTPDLDRYATEFSGKDSVNFYFGILGNLQGMIEQNVLLGELRSDLVSPTEYVTDSVHEIVNFGNLEDGESALLNRAAYYKVINQCNYYLDKVDPDAMKNNNYYMRREMAQVEFIRAWTYMQLVQNYGSVPFITKPVDNIGTGWEKNPPEGWATPDNLLDLLYNLPEHSLKEACEYTEAYGYPDYKTFNNGATNFGHSKVIFNANLVMGDLYLLRGASKQDYEKAAYHYHRYLDKENNSYVNQTANVSRVQRGDEEAQYFLTTTWGGNTLFGDGVDWVSGNTEIRTAIPSASNGFFGRVLTSIPRVYGFEVTSKANTTSTSIGTDDSGNEYSTSTTSGTMSVRADYKSRQVEPSAAYESLCKNQKVVYNDFNTTQQVAVEYIDHLTDARFDESAPKVRTDIGRLRFINKFCGTNYSSLDAVSPGSFRFRYGVPIYRTRQIYLKYAEALNRAGYPRHAFAIIRDGLCKDKMPQIEVPTLKEHTSLNSTSDTVWVRKPLTNGDDDMGEIKCINIEYNVLAKPSNAAYRGIDGVIGANCINLSELDRAKGVEWLNFEDFSSNVGVHQAGCGLFTNMDEEFSYDNVVAQRIADEKLRSGIALSNVPVISKHVRLEKLAPVKENGYTIYQTVNGYDIYEPTEAEIAAVETIIADEMALETAFEGFRYYDLMRMARHRINAGQDGAQWMAWLISRRDCGLAPYENPTQYDAALFTKLCDPNNWYLPAPKNN